MDAYRLILILHLFGLAVGLGGAAMLDTIVLVACRQRRISRELVELLHTASGLVAGAMVLLAISGIAFFFAGAEATPKFWAKMVIVLIACANGLFAHLQIFPWLRSAAASAEGRLFLPRHRARIAAGSAAISSVSWSAALVLGAWRGLSIGVAPILGIYLVVLSIAIWVSVFFVAPNVFGISPRAIPRTNLNSVDNSRRLQNEVTDGKAIPVSNAGRLDHRGSMIRTAVKRSEASGS